MTTASMNEFRSLARRVGNWGRCGPDDEVGKLNLISEEHVREATASVRRGAVVPLGIDLGSDGRQAGLHFRIAEAKPSPRCARFINSASYRH